MTERASNDLADLFEVLSRELGRWAEAADGIESGVGRILQTGAAGPADLAALQQLDALNQHLRELQRFCAILAAEPVLTDVGVDVRRRLAAAGLNLQGLADRLAGSDQQADPALAVELW